MKNRNRNANRLYIPPDIQRGLDQLKRDLICENDPVYTGNLQQVRAQTLSGALDKTTSRNIQEWLVSASLRRNGVRKDEAKRMLRA